MTTPPLFSPLVFLLPLIMLFGFVPTAHAADTAPLVAPNALTELQDNASAQQPVAPLPTEPAAAPSANVYDINYSFSTEETRALLALAIALAAVGTLILEEHMLYALLRGIFSLYPRSQPLSRPARLRRTSYIHAPVSLYRSDDEALVSVEHAPARQYARNY